MFLRIQYARITTSKDHISTGRIKKALKGRPTTANLARDKKKYPINGTENTIKVLSPNAAARCPRVSW